MFNLAIDEQTRQVVDERGHRETSKRRSGTGRTNFLVEPERPGFYARASRAGLKASTRAPAPPQRVICSGLPALAPCPVPALMASELARRRESAKARNPRTSPQSGKFRLG
jgi:hypothetical protein